MVFSSFNFLIFFPALAVLYWAMPSKYRLITLLIGSYFFYLNTKPVYALLVAAVTLSTWLFTRLIDSAKDETRKNKYLIICLILLLSPLFFFKYFSSINSEIISFLTLNNIRWPLPEIKLMLPVGISFYTFMAIGYTIDVYNGEVKPEKNLAIIALFISFFPLILSGPIERAKNMLPQFNNPSNIDSGKISKGLKLMIWGYFMKLVVADRLGIYVDAIYANIPEHNGTSLLLASVLYPFQVYADLGGYSLLAIGTAKVLGFEVMQNFKRPFFAATMSEFWRRWHISLISWLTDYIYTPLSFVFRKFKIWGIVLALMITFLISGIWHGAALTFIVWGLMQGTFLSIEALTNKKRSLFERKHNLRNKAWYILAGCSVTFVLFSASQIFGRSQNIQDAITVYRKIFTLPGPLFIDKTTLTYSSLGLIILLGKDFLDEFFPNKIRLFENRSIIIRFSSYLAVLFMIVLLGVLNASQFIYFQF